MTRRVTAQLQRCLGTSYLSPLVGGAGRSRDGRGARVLPERLVCGEELRRLVAPLELVLDARAAECTHLGAAHGIVDQLDDLRREIVGIVAPRVERSLLRGEAPLGKVELHDGL